VFLECFYVDMCYPTHRTYSREHLLSIHVDKLKVNRQTRKVLNMNRIWKPRRRLQNASSSAGENWSVACAGVSTLVDHANPCNSVQKSQSKLLKNSKLPRPKQIVSVGSWNVRTVREDSQLHILAKELDNWKFDILGIAETHRRGTEELYLDGYKFIAQGVEKGASRMSDCF